MSKLYFHIGWRKAGSSAIQSVLSDPAHRSLFDKYVQPDAGRKAQSNVVGGAPEAHHLLGAVLQTARARRAWRELSAQVSTGQESAGDKVLISSEMFSGHIARASEETTKMVADWLAPFDEVVFLAVFRRQDEFISSMHVQEAKHGDLGGGTAQSLTEYFPDANYLATCHKLLALHPKARIEAIEYSSDVLSGFFSRLGIDHMPKAETRQRRLNTRVGPSVYRLQTTLNRAVADDLSLKWLKVMVDRNLHLLGDLDGAGVVANPLRIDERKAILEHFWPSNQAFCATFGLDPARFDPARVDFQSAGAYNIPDRVAPETLEEIKRRLDDRMRRTLDHVAG